MENEELLLCAMLVFVLHFSHTYSDVTGRNGYLIDTTGCKIPRFNLNFTRTNATFRSCGHRKVDVRKITDEMIEFRTYLRSCCYRFISRTRKPCELKKTSCKSFKNGFQTYLESEFLEIQCGDNYKDYYAFVKKKPSHPSHENSFNVLLLGMDSMSRARFLSQMPLTHAFLSKTKWLDFKGYHKVATEATSKLAFLSNQNMSVIRKACALGLSYCNKMLIWKQFEKAGYVTAYGEDAISLPQTTDLRFYFKVPPTNHYLKPLFMAGENEGNDTYCTPQISSGEQVIRYAYNFMKTYKMEKFFGFFWINSFSHSTNLNLSPIRIDATVANFFKDIVNLGLYKNTFVILLSNHGLLYGPSKELAEFYYEERLPMLFMKVPLKFQQTFTAKHFNLKENQQRLVTPYDLHLTLRELSTNITEASAPVGRHGSCHRCRSLFREISVKRSCSDASIDERWCTCHEMIRVKGAGTRKYYDYSAYYSLVQSVISLHNKTKSIETKKRISPCPDLTLKKVLRIHNYVDTSVYDKYKTYYVITMMMDPGDVVFEAVVRKDEEKKYQVLQPLETLTDYSKNTVCTANPADMKYCICVDTMQKCLESLHKKTPKLKCAFNS